MAAIHSPTDVGDGGPSVSPGDVVAGKFRIERVLGQGGMGVVVAARHLQLDETVALKFLRAHATADPEALARFTREARAAAKLKSEHVARVLDAGVTESGTPYIVMEYLEGRNLGQVLEDTGRLEVATAAEYAIQACEGLAEAHARGIVHRDIKPENLFLVERSQGWRSLKILDFGISKFDVARGETGNIDTQSMMGSPCYMSPEQLRSTATVDHRTDIWSLGATIFELLAGGTAYNAGQSLPQLIAAILEQPTPQLAEVWPDISIELSAVVARCMAKDREMRFESAAELALALLPFAPKRARANVERALAVAQSSSASARSSAGLRELGSIAPPSAQPSVARGSSSPVSGTLRSAISPKAAPFVLENTDTLAAPTMTASEPRKRRGVPRAALLAAVVGSSLLLARGFIHTSAPPPPTSASAPPPTAVEVHATAAGLPAAPLPSRAQAEALSDEVPMPVAPPASASATPSAAPRPVHHAALAPRALSPSPSSSTPASLDIRMQR
jgi:eukaryotic-like serine/threonine-protein kinase